jgi:hypothetical protein
METLGCLTVLPVSGPGFRNRVWTAWAPNRAGPKLPGTASKPHLTPTYREVSVDRKAGTGTQT